MTEVTDAPQDGGYDRTEPVDIQYEMQRSYIVGSSRVDLQACKLEYSIVSPK